MPPSKQPRWASPAQAADHTERQGRRVPAVTIRRWAAEGRIPSRRIGPRNLQVDLNALDEMLQPVSPPRWLTESDERMARRVAAALLPLTDEQREKLSLLLHPGRGRHDAA